MKIAAVLAATSRLVLSKQGSAAKADGIGQDHTNAAALGNALVVCMIVPWALCFLFYTGARANCRSLHDATSPGSVMLTPCYESRVHCAQLGGHAPRQKDSDSRSASSWHGQLTRCRYCRSALHVPARQAKGARAGGRSQGRRGACRS